MKHHQCRSCGGFCGGGYGKRFCRNTSIIPVNETITERKRCASMLDLSADQIRLMAGEMTAKEMRLVKAILAAIRNKMEE